MRQPPHSVHRRSREASTPMIMHSLVGLAVVGDSVVGEPVGDAVTGLSVDGAAVGDCVVGVADGVPVVGGGVGGGGPPTICPGVCPDATVCGFRSFRASRRRKSTCYLSELSSCGREVSVRAYRLHCDSQGHEDARSSRSNHVGHVGLSLPFVVVRRRCAPIGVRYRESALDLCDAETDEPMMTATNGPS